MRTATSFDVCLWCIPGECRTDGPRLKAAVGDDAADCRTGLIASVPVPMSRWRRRQRKTGSGNEVRVELIAHWKKKSSGCCCARRQCAPAGVGPTCHHKLFRGLETMSCGRHIFAAMRVKGGEKRKSAELPMEQTPARSFAFLSDAARHYRKIDRFEFDFGDSPSPEFPRFKWAKVRSG